MSAELPDDLPPEWDALGREDAAALAPPPGAKERVQRRVALTLGLGAGLAVGTAVSSTAAAASAATTSAAGASGTAGASGAAGLAGTLLAKKALVLGVAAAVGIGGGTAVVVEVRSERARTREAPAAVAPAPTPTVRPQSLPPPPALEPLPRDTLRDERSMLDLARANIASGALPAAESLLTQHAEQFPAGQLAEEREALVIRLRVREGRIGEARIRAERFRREHPRSIQLPGIAEALGERR